MTEKSKSGEWYTPRKTIRDLINKYGFIPELDVTGAIHDNTIFDYYYDKNSDSLSQDWTIMLKDRWSSNQSEHRSYYIERPVHGVWMNCPTKDQQKFLYKAYEQWKKWGFNMIIILPTNVMSSDGFWDNIENPKNRGEDIKYDPIYHRIPFLYMGEKDSSARNAYISVFFKYQDNIYNQS